MNGLLKLRQAEDLLNEFKDQLDEKEEERLKLEAKFNQLTQLNIDLRHEIEKVNVDQMEELRLKLQREKEALLEELDNGKLINTKLVKSNQKLTNDIADLNVELERYRTMVQNVEKQQRVYDKKIQDEKNLQEKLRQDRDRIEREMREKETQRLNLLKELDERESAYEDLDKRYKQLRAQIDSNSQTTDDVGRYIQDLEKNKRNLGKNFLHIEIIIIEIEFIFRICC
jgi:chromosome segregation ATPase